MICNKVFDVNTDEMKQEEFDGTLREFACLKMNEFFSLCGETPKILSIQELWGKSWVRDNKVIRRSLSVSVYYII